MSPLIRIVVALACGLLCIARAHAEPEATRSPALEQFIRGLTAAQQGNPYQAVYFLEDAVRLDPRSPFLHVALAEQYAQIAELNQNDESYDRALAALDQALRIEPENVSALELKSRLLSLRGNLQEARRVVEKLATEHPENQSYSTDLLTLALTTGDFDKVDSLYKTLSPDSNVNYDLARQIVAVYIMGGETQRALPYMEALAVDDSLNPGIAYTLGTLYLQSGDTLRAIEEAERSLKLDSTDSRTWYLRLVIEYHQDRHDSVLIVAERARTAAPEDARSANLEGLTNLALGDSAKARERFARALTIDSTLFPAAGTLAMLYDNCDSLDLSVKYYEQAILYSDSAAIYLNNLAYTYAVRAIELERAMSLVEAALVKEPDNSSYLDTKGWIYFQMGDLESALTWIKKALKQDKSSSAILEHLGDVYAARGDSSQARKHWKRALKLDPRLSTVQRKLAP